MEKREVSKIVEINERKWRIHKFNAQIGGYIGIKLLGMITPVLAAIKLDKIPNKPEDFLQEDILKNVLSSLTNLTKSDYDYVVNACLMSCAEVLPAGFSQVLNENGTYGVNDIEYDTALVMSIVAQTMMFNISSFLAGSPLSSMLAGGLTSFQQNS